MVIRMENGERLSLAQMRGLVETSQEVRFVGEGREQIYRWVEQVLVQQEYHTLGKKDRGVQITRLIRQQRKTGQVRATAYRRRRFPKVYTDADVALLAKVDRAHEGLSGPATRRILAREYGDYRHREYARLAQISVAHAYNLRKRPDYRKQAARYESTRPRV